jgi:hypothetical protein
MALAVEMWSATPFFVTAFTPPHAFAGRYTFRHHELEAKESVMRDI